MPSRSWIALPYGSSSWQVKQRQPGSIRYSFSAVHGLGVAAAARRHISAAASRISSSRSGTTPPVLSGVRAGHEVRTPKVRLAELLSYRQHRRQRGRPAARIELDVAALDRLYINRHRLRVLRYRPDDRGIAGVAPGGLEVTHCWHPLRPRAANAHTTGRAEGRPRPQWYGRSIAGCSYGVPHP